MLLLGDIMSDKIVIRQNKSIIDVFFGNEGWLPHEWARFILINGKYLKFLKGASLSASDFRDVCTKLGVNHGPNQ